MYSIFCQDENIANKKSFSSNQAQQQQQITGLINRKTRIVERVMKNSFYSISSSLWTPSKCDYSALFHFIGVHIKEKNSPNKVEQKQ